VEKNKKKIPLWVVRARRERRIGGGEMREEERRVGCVMKEDWESERSREKLVLGCRKEEE